MVFPTKSVRGTKTVKGPAPLSSLMFSAYGRRAFVGRETENMVPVSKTLCRKPKVDLHRGRDKGVCYQPGSS